MKDIREQVASEYAEALRKSDTNTEARVSQAAGYGDEIHRYEDAAQSSFGCGNPLAFVGVKAGQTVLDLGSGAGLDLLVAADRVGPTGRVIGIDMTDEMLEAARANVARAHKDNVEIRKGYIEKLPVSDSSVDWVISNCVINLSPDKPAVFREIARTLTPGGSFSISDIVVSEDFPSWVRELAGAHTACVAGALAEHEYLDGLRAAGFRDVAVSERLLYDTAQLRGLVVDELGIDIDDNLLTFGLTQIEGKVWSAKIVGTKPA